MIVLRFRERGGRAAWHWRANAVVVAYLAATLVVMGFHVEGKTSAWLPVHVLLLGAATNAIVVWTLHFTTTLLHPVQKQAPRYLPRLVVLNVAVLGILFGADTDPWITPQRHGEPIALFSVWSHGGGILVGSVHKILPSCADFRPTRPSLFSRSAASPSRSTPETQR